MRCPQFLNEMDELQRREFVDELKNLFSTKELRGRRLGIIRWQIASGREQLKSPSANRELIEKSIASLQTHEDLTIQAVDEKEFVDKKIRRNSRKAIDSIFESTVGCLKFNRGDLVNCEITEAKDLYYGDKSAKLIENSESKYTVHVSDREWYILRTA